MPTPLLTISVPRAWAEAFDTPVFHRGLVLVSGGWQGDGREPVPILVAIDATTGAEAFRLTLPVAGAGYTEFEVTTPVSLPDGRIVVAVYHKDRSLLTYILDDIGSVLRVDDLAAGRESRLDVLQFDVVVKLLLGPVTVRGDRYVVSWVYRGVNFHLQVRDLRTGALCWEASERLVAASDDIAWCEGADASLVARDLTTGRALGGLPPGSRRYIAAVVQANGALVCVDGRSLDGGHLAPDDLVALVPHNGALAEQWRRPTDGIVTSVAGRGPIRAIVVCRDGVDLLGVAPDGRPLEREPLPWIEPQSWRKDPEDHPGIAWLAPPWALIACPSRRFERPATLAMISLDEPDTPVWRLELDANLRVAPYPRHFNLPVAAFAVGPGRLALRPHGGDHRSGLLQILETSDVWPSTVPTPEQLYGAARHHRAAWKRVASAERTIADLWEAHARAQRLGLDWGDPVQRAIAERAVDEPALRRLLRRGDPAPSRW